MPYTIVKVKGGYKVAKKNNPSETFSKKPLRTEAKAKAQEVAIILSELRRGEKKNGKMSDVRGRNPA